MQHIEASSAALIPLTRGQAFTLRELADVYMARYQGSDRQQATRLAYFVSFLGNKVAHDIDGDDIQHVLNALQSRGRIHNRGGATRAGIALVRTGEDLKPASINRYRTTIQAVLTWGRKKRIMPKGWVNPVGETERLPEDNVRTRYLTKEEYERLLASSRASYWKKLHVLIKLAVTTGARRGTLMGLRWSVINFENLRICVDRTKNGDPIELTILAEIAKELKVLRGASKDDELVFCGRNPYKPMNFEKAYRNAMASAGIEGACFHTLRHSHASFMAKNGASLLAIKDSMGHKTMAMTARYAHLCIDDRAALLTRIFATAA